MPSPSLALSSTAKTAPINLKTEDQVMRSYKAMSPAVQSHSFGCCPRPCLGGGNEDTPGPGAYRLKSTLIGHVADSRFRSNTGFSLRSRTTFGSDSTSSIQSTVATPGPGAYVCVQQRGGGLMVNPKERNAPRFSFPKGHFPRDKTMLKPRPGQYQLKEAMGPQALSSKINPPSSTFAWSRSRPSSSSSSIYGTRSTCSSRHTNAMDMDDVGPGSYNYNSACGKQVDSRKQNCCGTRFGTADNPSPPKSPSLSRGAKRGGTSTIMKP
eukprot:evm.model.NODE_3177_length_20199_cov_24.013615.4